MRRRAGVVLLTTCLAGCGRSALPAAPANDAGADVGPADAMGAIDPFVGTWQYTSGTDAVQCPLVGAYNLIQLAGQKEIFSRGISAALINSDPSSNCSFDFDVSGSTATAPAGQACPTTVQTDSGPLPTTFSLVSAVFTVVGTTGRFSHTENFTLVVQGTSIECMIIGTGDLLRIAQQ